MITARTQAVWCPRYGGDVIRRPSPLTPRQLECLQWISRGKSSTDIGDIMRISKRTVDHHTSVICEHLGVRTRVQAVAFAVASGWLAPSDRLVD